MERKDRMMKEASVEIQNKFSKEDHTLEEKLTGVECEVFEAQCAAVKVERREGGARGPELL